MIDHMAKQSPPFSDVLAWEEKLDALTDALEQLGAAPGDRNAKLSQPAPEDFLTALRETWTAIGTRHQRRIWRWPLAVLRSSGQTLTAPEDRASHAALPAIVRGGRGFVDCDLSEIEVAAHGMSWSIDPQEAVVYATYIDDVPHLRTGNCPPVLVRADVPRVAIHSLIGTEVIIDRPEEIVNIVAKRAPAPRPAAQSALAALAGLGARGFALPRI